MTKPVEAFQIPLEVAEAYESKFVPALFAEWAAPLLDVAGVGPGQSVLDVACGTGIVARTASGRVGRDGRVAGLDLNDAMLTVARRLRPDIEWQKGDAAHLPWPDASFDAVVCQMALMFFPDRVAAIREMARVVAPEGCVAVVVPASLADQPAYGPLVEVAARHAGAEAMSLLGSYWVCGDLGQLQALISSSGLRVTTARTRTGTARFGSIDELVATEVESTPLIERITDDVYGHIRAEARERLAPFTTESGEARVPLVGHVVAARP